MVYEEFASLPSHERMTLMFYFALLDQTTLNAIATYLQRKYGK